MTTEEIKELDAKMRRAIGTYDSGLVVSIAESVTKIAIEFAESLAKERAVEVLREMINKKKAEFESLKESAPHSNDSMRSCRIGIVTLLSAIEEMNDTFFAEKRKDGAE
jgi:adenylosuccinate synthase